MGKFSCIASDIFEQFLFTSFADGMQACVSEVKAEVQQGRLIRVSESTSKLAHESHTGYGALILLLLA